MTAAATGPTHRPGFTLVEAIAAMILLSVVFMGLAPTFFAAVERQKAHAVATDRSTLIMAEAARLRSIPFGTLDDQAGCVTVPASARFPHTRCITVTAVSAREREVRLVVRPASARAAADSAVLIRARPSAGNPFNTASTP